MRRQTNSKVNGYELCPYIDIKIITTNLVEIEKFYC